jgi:hypothetical protein
MREEDSRTISVRKRISVDIEGMIVLEFASLWRVTARNKHRSLEGRFILTFHNNCFKKQKGLQ